MVVNWFRFVGAVDSQLLRGFCVLGVGFWSMFCLSICVCRGCLLCLILGLKVCLAWMFWCISASLRVVWFHGFYDLWCWVWCFGCFGVFECVVALLFTC